MTTATITSAPSPERVAPAKKLAWVGPLGGVIAAVANLIVYFIARPLAGGELYHQMGPGNPVEALPVAAVVVSSFVPSIFATLLYAGLGRFTRRPVTIFTVIAVAFGLLSLASPLSLTIETTSKLTLSLMHLVAGAAITGALITLGREK
jgi:hypothetical protein